MQGYRINNGETGRLFRRENTHASLYGEVTLSHTSGCNGSECRTPEGISSKLNNK